MQAAGRRRREAMLRMRLAPTVRRRAVDDDDDAEADEDAPDALTPREAHVDLKRDAEQLMTQIVTHLDEAHFYAMHRAWLAHDSSCDMKHFVRIVREILPAHVLRGATTSRDEVMAAAAAGVSILSSEHTQVRSLIELFNEVDVNGDGAVEWEEFTRFIVEKAALYQEQNAVEKIATYSHAVDEPSRSRTNRHRHMIEKMVAIPRKEWVAVAEGQSSRVQIYHARTGEFAASFEASKVPGAMCYVESEESLLLACSDKTLNLFKLQHGTALSKFVEAARWPSQETLTCLTYADSQKVAYSGSTDGTVRAWNLSSQRTVATFKGHGDEVMDLLHTPGQLDCIISASMDSTVRVWNAYTERQVTSLRGHTKGVSSLAYNAEHRFLVSAGFDHDAYVWSPFHNTLLHRLKGHRASLVGCHAVEDRHELITADCGGILKLWDLRNFLCIDTFTTVHEPGDLDDLKGFQAFTHVKLAPAVGARQDEADHRIVCATKRLAFFDQHRVRSEPVTDDVPLRLVILNDVTLTLLVVSESCVKIWDAVRGTLSRTYDQPTKNEVTAVCLDDRRRKFFLGTSKGEISCHNYANGAKMKVFPSNDSTPVVTLGYLWLSKSVIAAFAGGAVRVYDEKELGNCSILRTFDESYSHHELQLMAHFEAGKLAATCSGQSSQGIRLWDSCSTKCEAILKTEDVVCTAMGFLEPFPLLFVCTADGVIRIWGAVQGHKLAGVCLAAWKNVPPDGSRYDFYADARGVEYEVQRVTAAAPHAARPRLLPPQHPGPTGLPAGVCTAATSVSAATFIAETSLFVVADERGNLRGYDLSDVMILAEAGCPDAVHAVPPAPISEDAFISALQRDSCVETEPGKTSRLEFLRRRPVNLKALRDHNLLKPHELRTFEAAVAEREASGGSHRAPPPVEALLGEDCVRFVWGVEYAHDESILAVSHCRDPKAIVSSGVDGCVRMWADSGEFRGVLLQGLAAASKNPCWSLAFDADAREKREHSFTDEIISQIDDFKRCANHRRRSGDHRRGSTESRRGSAPRRGSTEPRRGSTTPAEHHKTPAEHHNSVQVPTHDDAARSSREAPPEATPKHVTLREMSWGSRDSRRGSGQFNVNDFAALEEPPVAQTNKVRPRHACMPEYTRIYPNIPEYTRTSDQPRIRDQR
ncbi:WD40-repeat-containing domain protein [Pelagophyceae sp. CCMP2097]|nr:WD40-repeat-containing domain protein [Pelagophyceae sp. CCMP2097]